MSFDKMDLEQEAKRLLGKLHRVDNFRTGLKFDMASCLSLAPITLQINKLKKEKDFVILAHYYTQPEIIYGVADEMGDSYALSLKASKVKQQNIIFAGVRFMAETAKIINPSKNVYNSAIGAGCSLADSIDAAEVAVLKQKYPQAAFICYINSNADVKTYCDVTVTSSNVYDIVAAMPQKQIVFIPDIYMADNIRHELKKRGIEKELLAFGKTCCVHDRYSTQDIDDIRAKYPGVKVVCHPECSFPVCQKADFVGSTSAMLKYVKESGAKDFAVLSETGIVDCMKVENEEKNFLPFENPCAEMKKNSLNHILSILNTQDDIFKINLDEETIVKAKASIDNMFKLTEKK